jgi:hypothetical protein
LTGSCRAKKQDFLFELIAFKQLDSFPSASALEYDNGKLYVFGDDAPYLLVMDTSWQQLDTIVYSADSSYRISKETKPDIESAAILNFNGEKHLYALGSFATKERMNLMYFPLPRARPVTKIGHEVLQKHLSRLEEMNIEGFAFANSMCVMSNRANKTHRTNRLVITKDLSDTSASVVLIDVFLDSDKVIGMSGLYYYEEKDLLLFTASEEDTPSATSDGVIGNSYIGWFENFSKKMDGKTIRPEALVNLSALSSQFQKQKIESVCVTAVKGETMQLQLVADNDKGNSLLFKVSLRR